MFSFLSVLKAGRPFLDDECRNAVMTPGGIGSCHCDANVGGSSVRCERFLTIQHPGLALELRRASYGAGVATGPRLGQTPRAQLLSLCQWRQELLTLECVAGKVDV